jgi:hypothetical protein
MTSEACGVGETLLEIWRMFFFRTSVLVNVMLSRLIRGIAILLLVNALSRDKVLWLKSDASLSGKRVERSCCLRHTCTASAGLRQAAWLVDGQLDLARETNTLLPRNTPTYRLQLYVSYPTDSISTNMAQDPRALLQKVTYQRITVTNTSLTYTPGR